MPYAILSHVWDGDRELSYQALSRAQATGHRSTDPDYNIFTHIPQKVRDFCAFAREQGYDYGWVDTCCIDKTSSAELSEAINSMYAWYQQASVCYAYLVDVSCVGTPHTSFEVHEQFCNSIWHRRGWTLQELIAPRTVIFLSKDWRVLGTKDTLAQTISTVTGIDLEVLNHRAPLTGVSVARRMSWAARRITTRLEDRAYSLLGIFGIHMPTIYGEGNYAFVRLQEEILKQLPDQTLFVWGPRVSHVNWSRASISSTSPESEGHLFASSPEAFDNPNRRNMDVTTISHVKLAGLLGLNNLPLPRYAITGYGTRARLPTLPVGTLPHREDHLLLAPLCCLDSKNRVLALVLRREDPRSQQYVVGAQVIPGLSHKTSCFVRFAVLGRAQLEALREDVCIQDVYISHRLPQDRPALLLGESSPVATVACRWPYEPRSVMADIELAPWSLMMLTGLGYKVDISKPREPQPASEHRQEGSPSVAAGTELLGISLASKTIQFRISIIPCCFTTSSRQTAYIVRRKHLRAEVSYVWPDFSPPADKLTTLDTSHQPLSQDKSSQCRLPVSCHVKNWNRIAETSAVQATFSFPTHRDEVASQANPIWGRVRLTLRPKPGQRTVTRRRSEEDLPPFGMILDVELMEERPERMWGRTAIRPREDWSSSEPESEGEDDHRQPSSSEDSDEDEHSTLLGAERVGRRRAGC
ncbi:heterokaryon incompatibility protein-domain-containing protein [Dichomitus squalens]|uniref:Heterokaryon incompatibility protein-domain-containing protein n=1 Tax=Dichomitus squalens TaxID=114155 RepID=A0A4Q9N6J1_9APHY|nr:heterokaryon incompatibility protein-domain-containing protein [Dichomitus squalens]